MPSGAAQRPDDVLTMFGGKTVEVLNTDAEGRLVMADGIVAASQEYPDAIIDVATLTGAQLIALGDRTAGVMGYETRAPAPSRPPRTGPASSSGPCRCRTSSGQAWTPRSRISPTSANATAA